MFLLFFFFLFSMYLHFIQSFVYYFCFFPLLLLFLYLTFDGLYDDTVSSDNLIHYLFYFFLFLFDLINFYFLLFIGIITCKNVLIIFDFNSASREKYNNKMFWIICLICFVGDLKKLFLFKK